MTTEKQFKANILNAQNAGVKSVEGKCKIRHNSFKHGLTSKSILSGFESICESIEQYESLVQDICGAFNPRNSHEESLIAQMATALWKLRRFDNFEASLWGDPKDQIIPSIESKEHLQAQQWHRMNLALRYKHSMEAQYYRAFAALIEGRRVSRELDLFCIQGGNNEEV